VRSTGGKALEKLCQARRKKKLLGYRSRAEFVAEAVRDKLIQIKK
jgi:hypothetical protein